MTLSIENLDQVRHRLSTAGDDPFQCRLEFLPLFRSNAHGFPVSLCKILLELRNPLFFVKCCQVFK